MNLAILLNIIIEWSVPLGLLSSMALTLTLLALAKKKESFPFHVDVTVFDD